MGDRVEIEISGALFVEREVLDMHMGIDRGLLGVPLARAREIGNAIQRKAAGLEARKRARSRLRPERLAETVSRVVVDHRFGADREFDAEGWRFRKTERHRHWRRCC